MQRRFMLVMVVGVAASLLAFAPGEPAARAASPPAACANVSADNLADPGCEAEMAANPAPNVQPVPVGTFYPRVYAKVANWSVVYDAPNGSPVRLIKDGYVFVSIDPTDPENDDGWTKINPGEWLRDGNLTVAKPSTLTGVLVPGALPYPMAWVLLDTYCSPHPGGPPQQEELVYRYTRVNLFATVEHNGWNWYLIGPNRWINQRRVSVVRPAPKPANVGGRWISVDLYEQVVSAYDGDQMVFAGLVATGTSEWPTDVGLFHIESRHEFDDMTSGRLADQMGYYLIEEVPWTMYFDGYAALHGVYWHNAFGFPQSHGCINLSLADAQWLFGWTGEAAPNAPVLVWRSG
jgi:hypothetical protein